MTTAPATTLAPRPPDTASHVAGGPHGFRRLLRPAVELPVTATVVAAMLLVGGITGALWSAPAQDHLGQFAFGLPALEQGRVWTVLTGALVLPRPIFYLLVVPLLAAGLGWYERRVGGRRAATALILTHTAGVVIPAGLLALAPLLPWHWAWAQTLATQTDLGASAAAFGAIGAASALFSPRRRTAIRLVVGSYLILMVAKSGLLWDTEHLAAYLTGVAIGPRLVNRRVRWRVPPITDMTKRVVVASLVLVVAASNVVGALYPGIGGIFGPGVPQHQPMHHLGPALAEAVIAVLVADGLRRGRAAAWWLAALGVAAIGVNTTADSRGAVLVADIAWCALLLVLLLAWRNAWHWRTPDGFAITSLRRLAVATAAFLTVAVTATALTRTHFDPGLDVVDVVRQSLSRLTFTSPPVRPADGLGRAVLGGLGTIWALTLFVLLLPWLYADRGPDAGGKQHLKELIRNHGGGSIGWLQTWPRFATWTSRDGETAIGYCVVGTVAIALGDPVGSASGWPGAVGEFHRFCRYAGWTVCHFAATDALATTMATALPGWRRVQIGDDTVISLPGLDFRGRSWQDVRTARNRAGREGIRMLAGRLADLDDAVIEQVRSISRQWIDDKPLPEMGFTLGTVESAADAEVRTHVAIDASGVVHGVVTWLPVHEGGQVVGWTLDIMRRRAGGFRPVIEYLIAESAVAFRDQGYRTVSLSVAPLARRSATVGRRGMLDRTLDGLSRMLEPTYGFNSLLDFKAKFSPEFRPVYLLYGSALDLPGIAAAIGRAYLPHLSVRETAGLVRSLAAPRSGGA